MTEMGLKEKRSNSHSLITICIPTFNRKKQLLELVEMVCSIYDERINIVITDNCSTDDTRTYLGEVKNERIKVVYNKEPLPALCNMIEAIYNADGQFAFYCNDRDVIIPEKLSELADYLEKNQTLSFIHVQPNGIKPEGEIETYKNIYESLLHQEIDSHPTGMVFNTLYIKEHLRKEKYFGYTKELFTFSYLMRDIFRFGPSAKYNLGCWRERNKQFKKNNMSGTVCTKNLYFYPETKILNAVAIVKQIKSMGKDWLLPSQEEEIIIHILNEIANSLIGYKLYMSDYWETSHYGIKRRFVFFPEMNSIYKKYLKEVDYYLASQGYKSLREKWISCANNYNSIKVFKTNIRCDASIIKRELIMMLKRDTGV